jgi:DMSO/TMAO reductase YedYZ heme-binding membrane subunit
MLSSRQTGLMLALAWATLALLYVGLFDQVWNRGLSLGADSLTALYIALSLVALVLLSPLFTLTLITWRWAQRRCA